MNTKVPSKHKWTHDFAAGLAVRSMHFLARLSDRRISQLLNTVTWLFKRANENHPALEAVDDIKGIFENSSEGNRALRAILQNGRKEQAHSLIRGLLRHYTGAPPLPFEKLAQKMQDIAIDQPLQIGFYGTNDESPWLKKEYEESPFFTLKEIDSKDPVFDQLDAVEIASLKGLNEKQLQALFKKKIPVSILYSAIDNAETAQKLFTLAGKSSAPLRVLYPYAYYQPVRKIKQLLEANEIGEITLLRVRATVAGKGGEKKPSITAKTDVLAHEGFNHLPLLAFFGGPLEKAAAYLNPMKARQGGQALVNCKFTAPGRYGLLECTYAPEMYLRTSHLPYDLEAEIIGTDGTIWLSRGMSDRIQKAPIWVRIGRTSYTIGLETGMEHEWDHTYRFMVLEMAAIALKQTRPEILKSQLLSALAARDAAKQSNKEKKVIAI